MHSETFKNKVSYTLDKAKSLGATDCEVTLAHVEGFDVMVRNLDVETVEFTGEKPWPSMCIVIKRKPLSAFQILLMLKLIKQ